MLLSFGLLCEKERTTSKKNQKKKKKEKESLKNRENVEYRLVKCA